MARTSGRGSAAHWLGCVLALGLGSASSQAAAADPPAPNVVLSNGHPSALHTRATQTPGPPPRPQSHLPADPDAERRARWAACNPSATPCVRSRPARAVLLSIGVLGGAVSSALLFGLGDRLAQNDPAVLLAGLGALAGVGAITGAVAGRLGADGSALPDRLRPATGSLGYDYTGPQVLDEARPHALTLRFAPTLFFPDDQGRLRVFGHVGGWLNPRREVDPRPQFSEPLAGQQGTAPSVQRQQRLSIGVGADLAVALPYPVLRRSSWLGPAEIRYRPQVQIRRDRIDPGTDTTRLRQRTMLLPLSVGARWHLSPRQRFTLYVGPRFDVISFSAPGSSELQRGSMQVGPLHAEAWYDIDVPLDHRPVPNGRRRAVTATGMLSVGYIHSRFDGQGFDFGPVVGFFGPIHIGWTARLRRIGAPVAAQLGAFARLGQGTTLGLELGLVAPDLHSRRRRSAR